MSYDHRVINGADAARFIVRFGELLSDFFNLAAHA
jgi:pyruvate/2-oxoglutarate dehydrogenase complex dihydrolipoamide acyltransferase (E2) component